jgi:hypothetical protein
MVERRWTVQFEAIPEELWDQLEMMIKAKKIIVLKN